MKHHEQDQSLYQEQSKPPTIDHGTPPMTQEQEKVAFFLDAINGLKLPLGVGFRPIEFELVSYFLVEKAVNQNFAYTFIPEIPQLYKYAPQELTPQSKIPTSEIIPKWYFFTEEGNYDRVTKEGFWKMARRGHEIRSNSETIGVKRVLTYFLGQHPNCEETKWRINQYSLPKENYKGVSMPKFLIVLRRGEVSPHVDTSATVETLKSLPYVPRGFGFRPTNEELVLHYLNNKAHGNDIDVIRDVDIDIYSFEPWLLLSQYNMGILDDTKCYFFMPIEKFERKSFRATQLGYWQPTNPRHYAKSITDEKKNAIGYKKTLRYYSGKYPGGSASNWYMCRFGLPTFQSQYSSNWKELVVLCKDRG